MQAVSASLSLGMDRVKTRMCEILDSIDPSTNHQHLVTPTTLPFDWETHRESLSLSVYKTAYSRYCDWFRNQFCGTKCRCAGSLADEPESRPTVRLALESDGSTTTSSSEVVTPENTPSGSDNGHVASDDGHE